MEQTIKLYDADAYAIEFDAKVVSCIQKEDVYEVILDQTLFFPEEGGQSPDQGSISNIEVLDVQIKKGVITHTLKEAVNEGSCVHGIVDWTHRFNNMQQHSGEHIFSGLVHQHYHYDNVGFHLSNQIVTMDFNGVLTEQEVAKLETAANEAIVRNIPIQVTYPSKEELAAMDYRSKIEIEGQVRIVTIPGVDVCACCAPHVRRTGEIGMLKIINLQNYKGGVRISILCGFRALEDYRRRIAAMSELSTLLSANQEALPEAANKLKNNIQSVKSELNQIRSEHLQEKLSSIPEDQENVYLFEKNLDTPVIRSAINQLVKNHSGICGIFNENEAGGFQFILGSKQLDVRTVMNVFKDKLNARGGGNATMVQGSVQASKEEIQNIL